MNYCPKKDWFRSWFDSPYYHMLYSHRDDQEARGFLEVLLQKIAPEKNCNILDLACGKGRHSIFLHESGFRVTGIDLSQESIAIARNHEKDGLKFDVMDMRTFKFNQPFDCILNLFTSFGYFQDMEDNLEVLKRVKENLVPGGIFVLDYFNSSSVISGLPAEMSKSCGSISFQTRKFIEDKKVVKEILVNDQNQKFTFQERVQLLTSTEIKEMLNLSGLTPLACYGNYALADFDETTSDRFIIIARN